MFVVSAVIMKFEIDPFSIVLQSFDQPHDGGTLCWSGRRLANYSAIYYLFTTHERAASGQTPPVIKFDPLAEAQNYAEYSHHAPRKSGGNRALGIY
jgi:hypothetical protein